MTRRPRKRLSEMNMDREDYAIRMMSYLDGELPEKEREEFEKRLEEDAELSAELAKYRRLTEMTGAMRFNEPSDLEWRDFWNGLYNRLERKVGWILIGIGALLVLGYGLKELIFDRELNFVLKIGILAMIAGFVVLFGSVARGKRRIHKQDRYRGVHR